MDEGFDLKALKELAKLKRENPKEYEETIEGMQSVMKDLFGVMAKSMSGMVKEFEKKCEGD
ncbi:MAG: hypothetical protein ACTSUF_03455 [Candidatus Heimdallarchaeaceae archaeon]